MPYTYTDEKGMYTIHAFVDTPPQVGREPAFAPEPEEIQIAAVEGQLAEPVGKTRGKLSKAILRELGKLPKTKKNTKRLVIVADIPENDELKAENEKLKKEMEEMKKENAMVVEAYSGLRTEYLKKMEGEWEHADTEVEELKKKVKKMKKDNEMLHIRIKHQDELIAERLTDVSYFPYDEKDMKEMIGSEYDQNEGWEFTFEDAEDAKDWFKQIKCYACEEINDSYGEMSWKDACENAIENFVSADGEGGVKFLCCV